MLLRTLLFVALIIYLLYKIGFLRFNFHSEVRGNDPHRNFNRRPADGNVNVDSVPPKKKDRKDFKGGDYVDYEEIK